MISNYQFIEHKVGNKKYLQSCVFPCINSASHNLKTFYYTTTWFNLEKQIYRQYNTLRTHCSEVLQRSNIGFHQFSSGQWFRVAILKLQCCPVKHCAISICLVPTTFKAVSKKKKHLVRLGKTNFLEASRHYFLFSWHRIKHLARYGRSQMNSSLIRQTVARNKPSFNPP